jgi:CRP/FNR family transcriptional regulator, anaerobic regulatory protein
LPQDAPVHQDLAALVFAPIPPRRRRSIAPSIAVVANGLPLDGDNEDRLAAIAQPLAFAANQSLFMGGEAAEAVFLVISGMLRAFKSLPDGRRLITGFMGEGDFIGLAVDGFYEYAVEAVTPITLRRFPRHRFEAILDESPRLRNTLLHNATEELRLAQDHMVLLGCKNATEKIASFLLQLARRNKRGGRSPSPVSLSMTRGDIADYLGMTAETVSRSLSLLRENGVIDFRAQRSVAILRFDKLVAQSGGSVSLE